uniref:Uncharacterized protein n=1 Tax=Trichinella nativa TaxID=6335 RepID=A0A0V1KHM1_9BILA
MMVTNLVEWPTKEPYRDLNGKHRDSMGLCQVLC